MKIPEINPEINPSIVLPSPNNLLPQNLILKSIGVFPLINTGEAFAKYEGNNIQIMSIIFIKKLMKIIRDPIYGYIEIEDEHLPIISHPLFQKMRYIKQLGLTYYVYPGANHTRFEHSLGVYYLTKRFGDLSICALLHDVGHGAFSHLIEEVTKESHEKYTIEKSKIILEDSNYSSNEIIKLFNSKEFKIISGDFGTDRLDYLMRDSYYTGAKYWIIEYDTILNNIVVEDDIYLKEKVSHALEYLILARHYMFYSVYSHKTVRKINCMAKEAIKKILEYFSPKDLFYMDDIDLISKFRENRIEEWKRIEDRKLWKTVGVYNSLEEIPEKYFSSEYVVDHFEWKIKIETKLWPSREKFQSKILNSLKKISESKYLVFLKS